MNHAGKGKDPIKETALWEAIRALDAGNCRPAPDSSGTLQCGRPSWHELDARKIMFLRHRYAAGEWHGRADRWQPDPAQAEAAALGGRTA